MQRTLILAAALAVSAAADAHHSFAMFDVSKSVTISGTVKTFEWTNPHSWLWVQVSGADGGAPSLWGIETGSPSMLERRGIVRSDFKPGDSISVTLHPMRDGSPGGNFMHALLADGRTLAIVVAKEEE